MDGCNDKIHQELTENLVGLKRELKINAALAALSKAIISIDITGDEIFQMVLDQARDLTESQHGIVASIDPLNGAYMSRTLTKMAKEGCSIDTELYMLPEQPHGKFGTLWGHSLDIGTAFFTNNPEAHFTARGVPDGHISLENYLAVPVMFKGELLGQVSLANSLRDYTEADLETVGRLGELYAVALHNRRREEALRESEERFRQMFTKQQAAMYLVDPDTLKIIDANEAAQRFYGYDRGEFQKIKVTDLNMISEDKAKQLFYNVRQTQGRNWEFKHQLRNGAIRDVEVWSSPIDLKATRFFFTIVHDISERKRMEDKICSWTRQTKHELELAAQVQREALPQPFVSAMVDVDTVFLPYHAVSGDFYNFKCFEKKQKLCGYIIDVSGHGLSTALQTARVKILLDNILLSGRTIDETDFQLINQRMLQHLSEEAFAGVQYFEFDFQASILKVISAGIQFFLAAKRDWCELVPTFSSYLGMFEQVDIHTMTMPFKTGEIFGMMSDGVSDLIEAHGINQQTSLTEYMDWLKSLALHPDRSDDFTAVGIEIF